MVPHRIGNRGSTVFEQFPPKPQKGISADGDILFSFVIICTGWLEAVNTGNFCYNIYYLMIFWHTFRTFEQLKIIYHR